MLEQICPIPNNLDSYFDQIDGNSAARRAFENKRQVIDEETRAELEQAKTKRAIDRYKARQKDPSELADAALKGNGLEAATEIMANELADFDGDMEAYQEILYRVGLALADGCNIQMRYEEENREYTD